MPAPVTSSSRNRPGRPDPTDRIANVGQLHVGCCGGRNRWEDLLAEHRRDRGPFAKVAEDAHEPQSPKPSTRRSQVPTLPAPLGQKARKHRVPVPRATPVFDERMLKPTEPGRHLTN